MNITSSPFNLQMKNYNLQNYFKTSSVNNKINSLNKPDFLFNIPKKESKFQKFQNSILQHKKLKSIIFNNDLSNPSTINISNIQISGNKEKNKENYLSTSENFNSNKNQDTFKKRLYNSVNYNSYENKEKINSIKNNIINRFKENELKNKIILGSKVLKKIIIENNKENILINKETTENNKNYNYNINQIENVKNKILKLNFHFLINKLRNISSKNNINENNKIFDRQNNIDKEDSESVHSELNDYFNPELIKKEEKFFKKFTKRTSFKKESMKKFLKKFSTKNSYIQTETSDYDIQSYLNSSFISIQNKETTDNLNEENEDNESDSDIVLNLTQKIIKDIIENVELKENKNNYDNNNLVEYKNEKDKDNRNNQIPIKFLNIKSNLILSSNKYFKDKIEEKMKFSISKLNNNLRNILFYFKKFFKKRFNIKDLEIERNQKNINLTFVKKYIIYNIYDISNLLNAYILNNKKFKRKLKDNQFLYLDDFKYVIQTKKRKRLLEDNFERINTIFSKFKFLDLKNILNDDILEDKFKRNDSLSLILEKKNENFDSEHENFSLSDSSKKIKYDDSINNDSILSIKNFNLISNFNKKYDSKSNLNETQQYLKTKKISKKLNNIFSSQSDNNGISIINKIIFETKCRKNIKNITIRKKNSIFKNLIYQTKNYNENIDIFYEEINNNLIKRHSSNNQNHLNNKNINQTSTILKTQGLKTKFINSLRNSPYLKLFYYIKDNNFKTFKDLFEKEHFNIEYKDKDENTMLNLAVQANNYEITNFLINRGSDVNTQNNILNTPLHNALINSNFQIANLLIKYNANQELKNKHNLNPWENSY